MNWILRDTKSMFPKIMGILNATPDSFSDGNGSVNTNLLFEKAKQMLQNGADIIDIGGETTKPGSNETPIDIELERVLPLLKLIRKNFPNVVISVDTRKAEVAEEALKFGANIINDVSGLQFNPSIASIVAKHNASLVMMHSKETPTTMQNNPTYGNAVAEVFDFLQQKITIAKESGINHNNIIADVGIGFGKTTEHNLALLKNLDYFEKLEVPLLLGISRKRFIGEITDINKPSDRDAATMFIHSMLLNNKSVEIIRVHNVEFAYQLKIIYKLFQ